MSLCSHPERHHKCWSSLRPVDGSVLTGSAVIFISNSVPDGDPLTLITASASRLLSSSDIQNVRALSFPSGPLTMIPFVLIATPMKSPYCHLVEFAPLAAPSPRTRSFLSSWWSRVLLQWRLAILIHRESVDDGCRVIHHEGHHRGVRFHRLLDVGLQRVLQHPTRSRVTELQALSELP